MLALSAAYGVWAFNALFLPEPFALISASAFELVYISLSIARVHERRKATLVAASAVAVSVVYNSMSGLFHLRPALLIDTPLWADITLSILHGAPLAVSAYLVADLLLHNQEQEQNDRIVPLSQYQHDLEQQIKAMAADGMSDAKIAQELSIKPGQAKYWRTVHHKMIF
jgi:DNA-binding CsgD family transcriptional regulator